MTFHTFSLCYRKRCKKFGFSSSEESLATTPCSSSTEEEEAAEVQKRRRNRWNNAKSMTHYVIMYYIHVLLLIKLYIVIDLVVALSRGPLFTARKNKRPRDKANLAG